MAQPLVAVPAPPANAAPGTVDRVTIRRVQETTVYVLRPQEWAGADVVAAVTNRLPDLMGRASWWDADTLPAEVRIALATDDRERVETDSGPMPRMEAVELGDVDLTPATVEIEEAE